MADGWIPTEEQLAAMKPEDRAAIQAVLGECSPKPKPAKLTAAEYLAGEVEVDAEAVKAKVKEFSDGVMERCHNRIAEAKAASKARVAKILRERGIEDAETETE